MQEPAYQYRLNKIRRSEKPIGWIEKNFYLYDTGNLITLEDCQRRSLIEALSRDPVTNAFKYNTILWSWPKKSAKSSVIAAVADYTADSRMNASIKLVANDLKQADSRVGYYLRESILIGQRHGGRKGITVTPSGYKVTYPNGARVECVPIDPSGEAGGNDDMIVYSELWGWKSKAHQRMWSEMTLSPNKWGNSQRWIDTYAGITGESPILERLYEVGVKQGRQLWPDLEVYANDAAKMLSVWVTKPMFKWQSDEFYAQEAAQLTPSEFARMHRNQWATSFNALVPIEWWDSCQRELDPMREKHAVVIGLDAAVSNDCFAIVAVSTFTRDGVKHVQVRYCKIWKPPPGGVVSFAEPEAELRRLMKLYNVVCIAYDPTQMADMVQRLAGMAWWFKFEQGKSRAIADKRLYDMIRDRHLEHAGEPELRQHILNAVRKDEDGKTLRIDKRESDKKIDSVIALSMAVDRAMTLQL